MTTGVYCIPTWWAQLSSSKDTGDRMRGHHRVSAVTRVVALLLITIGISITGAASTPRTPSSQEISQQRMRLQETEALSAIPSPGAVADDVDGLSPAPIDTEMPHSIPSRAWLPVAPDGQFDPGYVDSSETPDVIPPPVIDMPPPSHITIPAVGIDTDVVEVAPYVATVDGQQVQMWQVADWAAGYHATTAVPGEGGNIVIAGHDDVRGEVFRGLHDIEIGHEVQLISSAGTFTYIVQEVHLRRERDVALAERLAVGQFMAPMPEERLTLITCWPYGIDDHRLIIVAKPNASSPH